MLVEGRPNVGFLVENVGPVSGFFEEPDITFASRISRLALKCRECRVLLGVQTSGETRILRATASICRHLADPMGLE